MLTEKQVWKEIAIEFTHERPSHNYICWKINDLNRDNRISNKLHKTMKKKIMEDVYLHSAPHNHFICVVGEDWNILRADYCYLQSYMIGD